MDLLIETWLTATIDLSFLIEQFNKYVNNQKLSKTFKDVQIYLS